ncbi:MAG: hypothetical protein FWG18_02460 [Alphaproteobacteria bacterium]|nr:hypothetical protein [Alphaproteobacteria bacterium]
MSNLNYPFNKINIITDRATNPVIMDGVQHGIDRAVRYMFDMPAVVDFKYIEDFGITHADIIGVSNRIWPAVKLIGIKYTQEQVADGLRKKDALLDYSATNVYVSNAHFKEIMGFMSFNLAPVLSRIVGLSIPEFVKKLSKMPYSKTYSKEYTKSIAVRVAFHEMMHIHPLYNKNAQHCKNDKCAMYYVADYQPQWEAIKEYSRHDRILCKQCESNLRLFKKDADFRGKIIDNHVFAKIDEVSKATDGIYAAAGEVFDNPKISQERKDRFLEDVTNPCIDRINLSLDNFRIYMNAFDRQV